LIFEPKKRQQKYHKKKQPNDYSREPILKKKNRDQRKKSVKCDVLVKKNNPQQYKV
jgi:hypothetical protein